MEIIFLLIGFSLCVALFFLGAFVWAVKSDQYEDEYGDARRLLHDDTPGAIPGDNTNVLDKPKRHTL